MEINPLVLIVIALATMFFGYGFGLFEGRGQGYKRRQKEEASDPALRRPVVQPEAPPAPPPVTEAAAAEAPVVPQETTLLRLSIDDSEQAHLDMDGQRIDTTRMEPQQRKRLIDLMVLMRPWIETGPIAPSKPKPVPAPTGVAAAAQRATVPPFDSKPVTQSVPARGTGPLAGSTSPLAARSTGPLSSGTGPLGTPDAPASAPTTMVGQIDAILQINLAGTPLAGRGIRLVESAQGGAMVVVGLTRYPSVGDVPEPEVQAAIRAAIAEWENKYTPG